MLATALKLAARRRRGIHVLVTITVPNSVPHRRRHARSRALGAVAHRAGQAPVRPARVRPLGEGPARRRRARDRRIEAREMRARAIVMPLGRDGSGGDALRQDARDGAGRPAVPGDHRVLARARQAAARPSPQPSPERARRSTIPSGMSQPRQAYRGGTLVLSILMVVVGVALLVSTIARGRRRARARDPLRAAVHRRRQRAPLPAEADLMARRHAPRAISGARAAAAATGARAAPAWRRSRGRRSRAPDARLAGALRGRLLLARRGAVLLARRSSPTARSA